jgi:hypothetical protein
VRLSPGRSRATHAGRELGSHVGGGAVRHGARRGVDEESERWRLACGGGLPQQWRRRDSVRGS